MSTTNMFKYVHGEVFEATKIAQPVPGTGIVNIVGSDGVTPIGFTSISLFDDSSGTTELVLDTDYTIQEKDIEYSDKEGVDIYRSVQIINAAYQSAVFYADFDAVGGYAARESFLDADNEYTGDNTFSGDNTYSGDNSFTGANTFTGATPQVASAWVNFNGTGVVEIRDDYNVDSITDNNIGDYTVNFDVDLDNANYSAVGLCRYSTTTITGLVSQIPTSTQTESAFQVLTSNQNNQAAVDMPMVSIIFFGGKS